MVWPKTSPGQHQSPGDEDAVPPENQRAEHSGACDPSARTRRPTTGGASAIGSDAPPKRTRRPKRLLPVQCAPAPRKNLQASQRHNRHRMTERFCGAVFTCDKHHLTAATHLASSSITPQISFSPITPPCIAKPQLLDHCRSSTHPPPMPPPGPMFQ